MWRTIPIPSEVGETPDDNAWWQAKDLNSLVRGPQGLTTFHGEPYSGEAYVSLENRSLETRTFMEGFEEGPYTVWDSNKKIVLLGILRHPFGPVGPWHKWDEKGRMISETIYDALGNKIIHRELDEAQNIVSQEHFAPVTLMTDPETGEQYPAPWL